MTVQKTIHYRYLLVHPLANEVLELNLYNEETNRKWEPYVLHLQDWFQKQREKAIKAGVA